MKKIFAFVFAVLMSANVAMADSIAGKWGVTGRIGTSYIYESEFSGAVFNGWSAEKRIDAGFGFAGGAGLMYGITDHVAVYFDVTYDQVGIKAFPLGQSEQTVGTVKMIDFTVGGQWRFMPKKAFVPYVGAGLDLMINRFGFDDKFSDGSDMEAANTYGGHLSVGADYFLTPNIALNAEIRGVYGTQGDITRRYPGERDVIAVVYNPTNISGFVGIRFFTRLHNRLE
jgi:outer membrane protein